MRAMNRFSAAAALAACASLVATPAASVDLRQPGPVQARAAYDSAAESVAHGRRWRNRDDVGVGDILAGVLILGGIAAVASAATRDRDPVERYPSRYPYPEDSRYRETERGWESDGLDRAVDMCVAEIEADRARVASVESASRGSDGWFVSGEVEGGALFTCRIDNDGRIRDVEVGGGYDRYSAEDVGEPVYGGPDDRMAPTASGDQYEEDVYLRARAGLASAPGG